MDRSNVIGLRRRNAYSKTNIVADSGIFFKTPGSGAWMSHDSDTPQAVGEEEVITLQPPDPHTETMSHELIARSLETPLS